MTIFIIFSVVSAFFLVANNAEEYAVGVEIITNTAGAGIGSTLTCDRSGAMCASDCSTLMVCAANNPTPITTITCSSPNQYCVGSTCTNVASPSCPNGPSFICTDNAIFPEPGDCTRYRVCEGGASRLYECPSGFVFNSKLNLCQRGTTPCTRIDCSRATAANPYIVYASNPAYYALCVNNGNGNIQTIMFKCPYEQFEVFDTSNFSCRFNCRATGYFQNPNSCGEYYYCVSGAASARPTLLVCPTGFVFDGTGCTSDATKCQFVPTTPAPADGADEDKDKDDDDDDDDDDDGHEDDN